MKAFVLRTVASAGALGLLVYALVAYQTLQRGELAMRESDRAFDAGQLELAVQHARRAAGDYVPGAEHVRRGYERLRAVARGAEREQNVELARFAWRSLRSAAVDSAHLWVPHPQALREADAELARLAGRQAPGGAGPRPERRGIGLVASASAACLGLLGWCGSGGLDERSGRRGLMRAAAISCLLGGLAWCFLVFVA